MPCVAASQHSLLCVFYDHNKYTSLFHLNWGITTQEWCQGTMQYGEGVREQCRGSDVGERHNGRSGVGQRRGGWHQKLTQCRRFRHGGWRRKSTQGGVRRKKATLTSIRCGRGSVASSPRGREKPQCSAVSFILPPVSLSKREEVLRSTRMLLRGDTQGCDPSTKGTGDFSLLCIPA